MEKYHYPAPRGFPLPPVSALPGPCCALSCGPLPRLCVIDHDTAFSVRIYARPHCLQDQLQPPVQSQEVGLGQHGRQAVLQERLPHDVAELVFGQRQQLQP